MGVMQLRTAALIGMLGLGVGWALGGRAPFGQASAPAEGRGSAGPRPLGVPPTVTVSPLTEQLRLKLDRQAGAPRPSRNPFVFGARRATPSAVPAPALGDPTPREAVDQAPAAAPPPPGAQFRLVGMATTSGPDGPELTAMVHDGQSLVFGRKGDTLAGGFEIVEVQEASVTLRDSAGGERMLRLR
jgi:hypothetical protein